MPLHPELNSLYRTSRFVNGLLLACSLLLSAVSLISALLALTIPFYPAWLLTVMGMAGAALLNRFRVRWNQGEKRKFQVGKLLLTHAAPRPMTLHYRGGFGLQGPMAIIRNQGRGETSGPVVAVLHVSKFHLPPMGESPVDVFHRPPEPCFLFRRKEKLFFGTAFDRHGLIKEARKVKRLLKGLLALVALGFLAGATYMVWDAREASQNARLAGESRKWPKTTGRILKSEVIRTTGNSKIKKSRTVFVPLVRYRYQTEDGPFTGERVSFVRQRFKHESDAERIVNRYPAGAEVMVYYAPEHPFPSVLKPGGEAAATRRYHHLLMGACAMLVSGVLVCLLIRFFMAGRFEKEFERMISVLPGPLENQKPL